MAGSRNNQNAEAQEVKAQPQEAEPQYSDESNITRYSALGIFATNHPEQDDKKLRDQLLDQEFDRNNRRAAAMSGLDHLD